MIEEVEDCTKTTKKHLKKLLKIMEEDEKHFKQTKEHHICCKTYTDMRKTERHESKITVILQVNIGDQHIKTVMLVISN